MGFGHTIKKADAVDARGMVVIGVTGVMASGKSTLCAYLQRRHGFYWLNADEVVHELYRFGQPGYKKIKEYFGEQFVGRREVYRGRLRRLVTKSPQKIWILNKLLHPLVAHEVNKKIVQLKRLSKGKNRHHICIEAVYFEPADLGKFVDRIITVDAPDSLIIKRLKLRKGSIRTLYPLLTFQRRTFPEGSLKILNDGSRDIFYKRIARAMREWLQ